MTCPVTEGDLLLQKFIVERTLGVGGMGTVVAARHQQLGQRVAIKLMHPELNEAEHLNRFLREGRIVARLRSAHVARVLDVGVLDSGSAYLVMEYLEGYDLEKTLGRRGALPLSEAVEYILQACEAVAEAHAAGIVHRDIKPENLFLTYDSYGRACIKVLDFGISKMSGEPTFDGQAVTGESLVIGTPLYMPPEQMRGARDVDARADIWSLGVVLFELVTGKPAWSGSTLSEVCVRVASDPAPSALAINPNLPPEVDEVISICLQKDPSQRFQSVLDLAHALAALDPEIGVPALACMRQLLGNDVFPEASGRSQRGTSSHDLHRFTPPGTSTAWGEQRTSQHSDEPQRYTSLGWRMAPVVALAIVGVIGGALWSYQRGGMSVIPASNARVLETFVPTKFGRVELEEAVTSSTSAADAGALRRVEAALPPAVAVASVNEVKEHPIDVAAQNEGVASIQASAKANGSATAPKRASNAGPVTTHKPKTKPAGKVATPAVANGSRSSIRKPRDGRTTPDWGGRK